MALNLLFKVKILIPTAGSDLAVDDIIDMYYDDVALEIVVKRNDVVYTGSAILGRALGPVDDRHWVMVAGSSGRNNVEYFSIFTICEGTTKKTFTLAHSVDPETV